VRVLSGMLAVALLATGAGCAASPLGDRFDAVSKEIAAARSAGAPRYAAADYNGAVSALDLAKDAEDDAIDMRVDAEQEREHAKNELKILGKLTAEREDATLEAEKRRAGAEALLTTLRRREAELRTKGVSEAEIDRALGDQIALAELERNAARASLKTLKAEIELVSARKQESQARIITAEQRMSAAGQQLLHASALCDTAGAAAREAQAHAIARRKAELNVR
jgi:hypothetical protein